MMQFLEALYRSPFGRVMSILARAYALFHRPFIVYGYRDPATGQFRKYTRMSSTVNIMNPKALAIGEDVWVGHHTLLDATEGLIIEDGAQIANSVNIFTHGSEHSIRLLGKRYVHIPNTQRKGYTRGGVKIGAYTFIGSGSVILPGVQIGKGCLIGSCSLVTNDVPDYAVVIGQPGEIKGSTIDIDALKFEEYDFSELYYDREALRIIQDRLKEKQNQDSGESA